MPTEHILNLKDEVLRFASSIDHKHDDRYIKKEDSTPKDHSSTDTTYGVGTSEKYGHIKMHTSLENINNNDVMPASANATKAYIDSKIASTNTLINNKQDKLIIINNVDSFSSSNNDTDIPTAKIVRETINNYKDLECINLGEPKEINANINSMVTPGYYKQNGEQEPFIYGNEKVYYINALIKVEKQGNRVIQHVYATNKVITNGTTTYKINSCEYTRWGTSTSDWRDWQLVHKPYTKTARINNIADGINNLEMYENTSGFIIHWDQNNDDEDSYIVNADLYEYETICNFNPPLPITGNYIFGNLIGRMDVKITSEKMQMRSNMSPGGRIIHVHESYFVPRNG